jgi:stage II sporulation protein D
VALLVVDVHSEATLLAQQPDVLDRPTYPGSIAKVFSLIAAMEAGEVDPSTRIACRGRETVGGRTLVCSHPRFGRALTAAEALAHSCNTFFVAVAKRTTWPRIAAVLDAAGLPASPPPREPALGAVGLDGPRVAPRALLTAFARAVERARRRDGPNDRMLLAGLRDAAREGTARAFGDQGIDALAKTGSGRIYGGAPGGLVVALSPADAPRYGVVVIGAGIAGRDAAAIGAAALKRAVPGLPVSPRPEAGGPLRLGTSGAGGRRVVRVALEEYIGGVVSAEAPPGAPPALREALSIAARSYALANLGRHGGEGFDLCDLSHCQAHRPPDTASLDAARATAGLVLTGDGHIVSAFHSASCGGALESPGSVWRDDAILDRYMPARPDPVAHGPDAWRSEIAAADLLRALREARIRGPELRDLTIASRTPSGRARELRVSGLAPGVVDAETFRRVVGYVLGWQVLKSSLYTVTRTARGYRFDGRGRGHGVGLCVAGAAQLAAQGRQARDILAVYFPGTVVTARAGGDGAAQARLRVVLPALDEADRLSVEGLVEDALSDLERRLSVTRPPGLVVRFHPTVQSYLRAGGRSWWTGGVTRGRRVELAPLSALRKGGLLERTVRHELVHALTADALADRPCWVNEGLAAHLAQPGLTRGDGSPGCPPDEEFDAARSAAALAELYDRAAVCVARALDRANGDWRRATWGR